MTTSMPVISSVRAPLVAASSISCIAGEGVWWTISSLGMTAEPTLSRLEPGALEPHVLELSRQLVRGPHPPGVGHQLGQPPGVHYVQPQHHQRPAVIPARGEEQIRLTKQQRLLLRLVTHVQHGDIVPDDPALPGKPLRVGPDEPLAA